ncbi:response regulator [Desulfonema ishimotonii]|uniref:Response regulator n=1 Tax=Desulfonema ishimotonii TaxID=45657 RepID=A0A401FZD9_9BACT|nr:response regulator [Desulfonema ishimotonii]GBC62334.1 response regulator [Desulfonema ishimotonii]
MARILIIDDEPQIRNMLKQMVERAGYDAEIAENGRDGLKLNAENPADLIITDIFMPEKEGIETIMALRKDHPDTKIIAISGGGCKGQVNYLKVAKSLGAMRTLNKPIERHRLLETIQELLA